MNISIYKYDDATWHSEGDFPSDLSAEAGATHIGMFIGWAILRKHSSDALRLHRVRLQNRMQNLGAFCLEHCAGTLLSSDLSESGNQFARSYYMISDCKYYKDLEDTFGRRFQSLYHIPDDWEYFQPISEFVDERYRYFQQSNR